MQIRHPLRNRPDRRYDPEPFPEKREKGIGILHSRFRIRRRKDHHLGRRLSFGRSIAENILIAFRCGCCHRIPDSHRPDGIIPSLPEKSRAGAVGKIVIRCKDFSCKIRQTVTHFPGIHIVIHVAAHQIIRQQPRILLRTDHGYVSIPVHRIVSGHHRMLHR